MKNVFFAIAFASFLFAAPAFAELSESERLSIKVDVAKEILFSCMEKYAAKHAKSESTAREIAEAGGSKCDREYADFKSALKLHLIESAGWQGGEAAEAGASKILSKAKDRAVQIVVEKRVKK